MIDVTKVMNANEECEIPELLNVGGEMQRTKEENLVAEDVIGN